MRGYVRGTGTDRKGHSHDLTSCQIVRFWHALAFAPTQELVDLARASERCGIHGVTVSDHLFYSEAQTSAYPYSNDGSTFWNAETPWPEPWAAISAMAAVTERLHFTTNIYVGP